MKVTYNSRQDTLHILFSNAPITESSRQNDYITLDYDQHGHIVGLELAAASEQIASPFAVDVIIAQPSDGSKAETKHLAGATKEARLIAVSSGVIKAPISQSSYDQN